MSICKICGKETNMPYHTCDKSKVMSDTPRTDALHIKWDDSVLNTNELNEVYKQLEIAERELNEAIKRNKQMALDAFPITEERVKWEELLQSRDQWKEDAERLANTPLLAHHKLFRDKGYKCECGNCKALTAHENLMKGD